MAKEFYKNSVQLRDGAILLYTRGDTALEIWQCRLRVTGLKGYVVKSTKTRNLAEASQFAEDLYDELRFKVKNDLPVGRFTFTKVWETWFKSQHNRMSPHRKKYHRYVYDLYFKPYFGDMPVEAITATVITDYWPWRLGYWKTGPGSERDKIPQGAVEDPSPATINMEQQALSQVLRWSERQGYIVKVPQMEKPLEGKKRRRPAFTEDELKALIEFMEDWVNNARTKWHCESRRLLRDYVLVMVNSGMRPKEARQLRWRDVTNFTDKNDNEQLLFNIAPTTKTGQRDAVPQPEVKHFLNRIRSYSKFTKPNDYVFANRDGEQEKSMKEAFGRLLDDADLVNDQFGSKRTVYSLRHTYITQRLLKGDVPIDVVADNCGTSVDVIQSNYKHVQAQQRAHLITSNGAAHAKPIDWKKEKTIDELARELVLKEWRETNGRDPDPEYDSEIFDGLVLIKVREIEKSSV